MAFYIVKSAVYVHGVYGPYKTRKAARVAFAVAYRNTAKSYHNNFDGHHDYHIIRGLPVDVGATLDPGSERIEYESKRE
jgi:hypothetical protein